MELLVTMVVMVIVSGMIITIWFGLQSSYAHTVGAADAQSTARDALARVSSEIRDAQPPSLTTPSAIFTVASSTQADFYSSYNQPGTASDGSGVGTVRLTRLYLTGSAPYWNLSWERDTNNNGTFDSSDRTMVLATDVVNTATTPLFTYLLQGSSTPVTSVTGANLANIVSVNVCLIVDSNLNNAQAPVTFQATVFPRNAP